MNLSDPRCCEAGLAVRGNATESQSPVDSACGRSSGSAITQFPFLSFSPLLHSFSPEVGTEHFPWPSTRPAPGDMEVGMAQRIPTRSTGSSGRKESRCPLLPILRSLTEESPEEGDKRFQKRVTSPTEMTLALGPRG